MKKILISLQVIAFLSLLMLSSSSPVLAAEDEASGNYFSGAGTKVVRGFENFLTSPAEIPCTINFQRDDKPTLGWFTGTGLGVVNMIRRMMVGASEILTFFVPMDRAIPRVCTEPWP